MTTKPEHSFLLASGRAVNWILDGFICLACAALVSYALYSLWDNAQVYAQVDNLQASLMSLKPVGEETVDETGTAYESGAEGGTELFEKLTAINPDICAWLTVDGTQIDLPVLQGEDNYVYLNRDAYGEYATSGSLFLDYRCDDSFAAQYALIYGHHMKNGKMFGDLDLFYDASFFEANGTGTLYTRTGSYGFQVAAILTVKATDPVIYAPVEYEHNGKAVVDYAAENAELSRDELLKAYYAAPERYKVLCLTTCSSRFRDARTVVVALVLTNSAKSIES